MAEGRKPVSWYDDSGDHDDFLVGIVGEAEEEGASYVEVHLLSDAEDPVGWVMVAARYRYGNDEGHEANVILDGHQAAMLAVVLQDAARQWQGRDVSHNWQTDGDEA